MNADVGARPRTDVPPRPGAPPPLPDWWPHRAASRCVADGGWRWHLQRMAAAGDGAPSGAPPTARPAAPVALLLHGTGSSAHSWRTLAPLLAQRFDVLMPDLPGHGWTEAPPAQPFTLPAVAEALGGLLDRLALTPALVVGHSAGAAIALRLALDRRVAPRLIVSINGALQPLQGRAGRWFAPMARLLAMQPLVAPGFAAMAGRPAVTRRLLDGTGSTVDGVGERCYAHLLGRPDHVAGTLRLMASWDLAPLEAALPALAPPLLLLAADGDRTVPPAQSAAVAARVARARLQCLPGLGHLAHEEDAPRIAAAIGDAWDGDVAAAAEVPPAPQAAAPLASAGAGLAARG